MTRDFALWRGRRTRVKKEFMFLFQRECKPVDNTPEDFE